MTFFDFSWYGNTLRSWLLAAGVALVVFLVLRMALKLVVSRFSALAGRTSNYADDIVAGALGRTRTSFILFVSLYAGSRVLLLPPDLERALRLVGISLVLLQFAFWGNAAIATAIRSGVERTRDRDAATATSLNAIGFLARLVLYTILLLIGLANAGVEIGPALAGLGIGGIAVALAVQNILGDLFASLSIVLDKPFVLGDFIVVGDMSGTVERVGLKTTRLRSVSGEQLVVSNSDLLASRVRNYRRMYERRVMLKVGLVYGTPPDGLERAAAIIRSAIEAQEKVRFDRSHFQGFGDSALNIEAVYYVTDPSYNLYMDTQQRINIEVYRRFAEEGLEFAFPTQTVHIERPSADA